MPDISAFNAPRARLATWSALLLLAWSGGSIHADATQSQAAIAPESAVAVATRADAEAPDFAFSALSPLAIHPRTSLTIVEQLERSHYLSKSLDDGTSSEIFEKYLDLLDGGRAFFYAGDVAKFEQYRYNLDDALKRGDLAPAFDMFNTYQERVIERFHYLLDTLNAGLEKMNFDLDEQIEIDRENTPWPANATEMDELWRKRLKSAVLNMKLNGKPLEEIQTLLIKRYSNRLKQTQQTKSEDAFQLYVNAFASTYDPHTQYLSPRTSQNFNINMSLSLEGIGAVLRTDDEYTTVVSLVTAGPADKAGNIRPSDKIVSVGHGESGPMIDVVGWRLDDVVDLIRGPKGSVVRLEVVPSEVKDGTTRIISITRDTVKLEEQSAQKKLLTLKRGARDYRVGIIEIPAFYVDFKALQEGDPEFKSTTRDVRKLIDELKAEGMDALVVDLRNNGGGSLQEADSLTGLFIKSGPTVQVKSANRRPSIYADTDERVAWDGPMAVLVNRLSASASEIFAGAIQDYERGLIIGSQTFGKGTVQTLIPLNRGQLKVTAAKYYRVSGQSTQHQGVLPDIRFPELFDTDEIGESSLEDALAWDMIQPAVYPRSNQVHSLLNELQNSHDSRVADNPDFAYLQALAAKAKERSTLTHVSLNETVRRKEKEEEDAWRLALENQLRKAKGEPEYATLDELDAEAEAEADANAADHIVPPAEDDPLIVETGQILLDFIALTRQVALVENVPATGMREGLPGTPRQLAQ